MPTQIGEEREKQREREERENEEVGYAINSTLHIYDQKKKSELEVDNNIIMVKQRVKITKIETTTTRIKEKNTKNQCSKKKIS